MSTRKPPVKLPKGAEAEEELARIRRNERRARRRAIKAASEKGLPLPDEHPADQAPPPPAEFAGIPSPEQLKNDFWSAFAELGGTAGLVAWGRRYPKEFYSTWARVCLPKAGNGSGDIEPNSLEDMLSKLGDDE